MGRRSDKRISIQLMAIRGFDAVYRVAISTAQNSIRLGIPKYFMILNGCPNAPKAKPRDDGRGRYN